MKTPYWLAIIFLAIVLAPIVWATLVGCRARCRRAALMRRDEQSVDESAAALGGGAPADLAWAWRYGAKRLSVPAERLRADDSVAWLSGLDAWFDKRDEAFSSPVSLAEELAEWELEAGIAPSDPPATWGELATRFAEVRPQITAWAAEQADEAERATAKAKAAKAEEEEAGDAV